jgi:clan AA aspartic protease
MSIIVTRSERKLLRGSPMGEIRVRVKLTNAVDEELARRKGRARKKVRTYEADAIVDTGAVQSVIPADIVEKLGVSIRGERVAQYADGRKETVGVTGPVIIDILGRDTLEEALVLGDEVLIGQTVLEKLDLLADCTNRRVIPNPAHPDQPVSMVR